MVTWIIFKSTLWSLTYIKPAKRRSRKALGDESNTKHTHPHTQPLWGEGVAKKKKKTLKTKNHPFEDYDSGNLLGFFFSIKEATCKRYNVQNIFK